MNLFLEIEALLQISNPADKISSFRAFYEKWKSGSVAHHNHDSPVVEFTEPSYSQYCKVVNPADVPVRNNLSTVEGQSRMLHAIAHIEYSAIDLALDAAYRFRNLPEKYYTDWLEVAREEVDHFEMICSLLEKTGVEYGHYPVHASLHEAARKTPDLLKRMAVVPRYLEANGLDANPKIMAKISRVSSPYVNDILKALHVILEDEIDHVRKGDHWFRHACTQKNISTDVYFDVVDSVFPGGSRSRGSINREARIRAGFSEDELRKITSS